VCADLTYSSNIMHQASCGSLPAGAPDHVDVRCFRWAQALYRLQPKCKVDDLLAENAIAIFDGYVKAVHERVRPRQPVWLELPANMLHRYQIPCARVTTTRP